LEKIIAASLFKLLDESMSAWCPRKTKTGGLPNISFILRKPEPLGKEFKSMACLETGKKQMLQYLFIFSFFYYYFCSFYSTFRNNALSRNPTGKGRNA
jgi:hypothetical protein